MINAASLKACIAFNEITAADIQRFCVCIHSTAILVFSDRIVTATAEDYVAELNSTDLLCGDHRRIFLILYECAFVVCAPDTQTSDAGPLKGETIVKSIVFRRVHEQLYGHIPAQCIRLIKRANLGAVTLRIVIYQSRVVCPVSAFSLHPCNKRLIRNFDLDDLVCQSDCQLFFCVERLKRCQLPVVVCLFDPDKTVVCELNVLCILRDFCDVQYREQPGKHYLALTGDAVCVAFVFEVHCINNSVNREALCRELCFLKFFVFESQVCVLLFDWLSLYLTVLCGISHMDDSYCVIFAIVIFDGLS